MAFKLPNMLPAIIVGTLALLYGLAILGHGKIAGAMFALLVVTLPVAVFLFNHPRTWSWRFRHFHFCPCSDLRYACETYTASIPIPDEAEFLSVMGKMGITPERYDPDNPDLLKPQITEHPAYRQPIFPMVFGVPVKFWVQNGHLSLIVCGHPKLRDKESEYARRLDRMLDELGIETADRPVEWYDLHTHQKSLVANSES